MADTLTDIFSGRVQVKMQFTRLDTQEIGYAQNKKNETTSYEIADGYNAAEAETIYAAVRTIAPNSVDTIDLLNIQQESLESLVPLSFAKVRILRIVNKSQTAGEYLYFGASETDPTGSFAVAVGPGSETLIVNYIDSYLVASGNSSLRTYNPNANSVDYEIYIVGAPA